MYIREEAQNDLEEKYLYYSFDFIDVGHLIMWQHKNRRED